MPASFTFTKMLNSNLSITPQDSAVIRSDMSDGYSKQFDRFSNNFITFDMTYLLDVAQQAAFMSWWKINKAVFFNFVEPFTDATVQGRIVSGAFNLVPASSKQNYYILSLQVERVI